jgi:hypothetical protein
MYDCRYHTPEHHSCQRENFFSGSVAGKTFYNYPASRSLDSCDVMKRAVSPEMNQSTKGLDPSFR